MINTENKAKGVTAASWGTELKQICYFAPGRFEE